MQEQKTELYYSILSRGIVSRLSSLSVYEDGTFSFLDFSAAEPYVDCLTKKEKQEFEWLKQSLPIVNQTGFGGGCTKNSVAGISFAGENKMIPPQTRAPKNLRCFIRKLIERSSIVP